MILMLKLMDLRIDRTAKNMNSIKSSMQQTTDCVQRIEVCDTHTLTHSHTRTLTRSHKHTPKSHTHTHTHTLTHSHTQTQAHTKILDEIASLRLSLGPQARSHAPHRGHVSICSLCGRYGHEHHELASGGVLHPQTAPAVLKASEGARMWGECD
jgi:hypothetical protein